MSRTKFTHVSTTLAVIAILCAGMGCGSTPKQRRAQESAREAAAAEALAVVMEPVQDVLVWTFDDEGRITTTWLAGNAAGGKMLNSRKGLVFPAGDKIWELVYEQTEIPLCDCEAWSATDMEAPCPTTEETVPLEIPFLEDLAGGETVPLAPALSPEGEDSFVTFDSQVTVEASVGPYLLVGFGQESLTCGAVRNSRSSGFAVIDASTGKEVDLFTAKELARILENEQREAFELMRNDHLVAVDDPEDLEFTGLLPTLVPGLGVTFNYRFTADASFTDSQGNRSSYTRSMNVPAKSIPKIFEPYVLLPPALQSFVPARTDVAIGGWIPITVSENKLPVLLEAFSVGRVD